MCQTGALRIVGYFEYACSEFMPLSGSAVYSSRPASSSSTPSSFSAEPGRSRGTACRSPYRTGDHGAGRHCPMYRGTAPGHVLARRRQGRRPTGSSFGAPAERSTQPPPSSFFKRAHERLPGPRRARSILLDEQETVGTPTPRQTGRTASRVWGCTPSVAGDSPAGRSPARLQRPLQASAEKSTWPGVSSSVHSRVSPSSRSRACLEKMVMPRDFSSAWVSRKASPCWSTRPSYLLSIPAQ